MTNYIELPFGKIEDCAASANEIRDYISQPYLDLKEKGNPVIVATNGHVLVCYPVTVVGKVKEGWLDREAMTAARKVKKQTFDAYKLVFEGNMHGVENGVMYPRPSFKNPFPDWRAITEKDCPDPHGKPDFAVDMQYINRVARAMQRSNKTQQTVVTLDRLDDGKINPRGKIIVKSLGGSVDDKDGRRPFAVVMPVHSGEVEK